MEKPASEKKPSSEKKPAVKRNARKPGVKKSMLNKLPGGSIEPWLISSVVFAACAIPGLSAFFSGDAADHPFATFLVLPALLLSVLLVVRGIRNRKKRLRFIQYLHISHDTVRDSIPLTEFCSVTGIDHDQVEKDLTELISLGVYSKGWVDHRTDTLMLTDYDPKLERKPPSPPRPEEAKSESKTVSRSEQLLREIRDANDRIADREISEKIDRLEEQTRRMFSILEQAPEKEEKIDRFLNYYLPTALKTLGSYARIEDRRFDPAYAAKTRAGICSVLDDLIAGSERQIEKLFESDLVDISADVAVMRQMLARDGLVEDEITEIGAGE